MDTAAGSTGAPLASLHQQQRGWERQAPVIIERADGCTLYDTAATPTSTASRRCGATSTATATRRSTRRPGPARSRRALDDARALAPRRRQLAERLVAIAPPGLSRVFYSDNGSTAARSR
jgi:adenosylmethionine-8-amino-7-oxononanoate aminotransferase